MYVRKFEGESLDDTLKKIKTELGPDAIILKTVTNKGLKGAFKKSKIEVTAAISEKNYTRKAKDDTVLDDNQKQTFYSDSSSHISNMIDNHEAGLQRSSQAANVNVSQTYGKAGLNKQVQNISNKIRGGLDEFLSLSGEQTRESNDGGANQQKQEDWSESQDFQVRDDSNDYDHEKEMKKSLSRSTSSGESFQNYEMTSKSSDSSNSLENSLVNQEAQNKIDELEKKIFELTQNIERIDQKEPSGIYELRTTLKSLDVIESYIQKITKKALFELSDDEVQNSDVVFEFALREMLSDVNCQMPLFSSVDSDETPVVSVLISETSCGQSSMLQKIAGLKEGSVLISGPKQQEKNRDFTKKVLGIQNVQAGSIAEIISETRKALEKGKSVFIDYRNPDNEVNDAKKFVDGLKRSFDKVEVLVCLSAIHSELYNRKVLSRYGALSDGLALSKLDLCLNFGGIFNLATEYDNLPFKFYGTGEIAPDDIESATAERILAGLFRL